MSVKLTVKDLKVAVPKAPRKRKAVPVASAPVVSDVSDSDSDSDDDNDRSGKSGAKTKLKTKRKKSDDRSKPKAKSKAKAKTKSGGAKVKLLKHDLIHIAILRNEGTCRNDWCDTKTDDLKEMLLPLTEPELAILKQSQEKRKPLKGVKSDVLKKTLMMAGFGKGSKYGDDEKIDLILDRQWPLYKPMIFDPDQQALMDGMKSITSRPLHEVAAPLAPGSGGGGGDGGGNVPLIIAAGPGSGKTTSISYLTYLLSKAYPTARILVAMFNVAAERTAIQRIELVGGKAFSSSTKFDPWHPASGVYCLTLNKLAARIICPAGSSDKKDRGKFSSHSKRGESTHDDDDDEGGEVPPSYDPNTEVIQHDKTTNGLPVLDEQIPVAAEIITRRPMRKWDFILIDEAQDVHGKMDEFAKQIKNCAKYSIFGGDPRQEIYSGARFFSSFWTGGVDTSPETPRLDGQDEQDEVSRSKGSCFPKGGSSLQRVIPIVLRYNHRSHPKIVETLNVYSRFCFPTLHHDQIASRVIAPTGTSTSGSSDEKTAPSVLGVSSPGTGVPHPVQTVVCEKMDIARWIATELMKHKPTDVYIIAPISIKEFNIGPMMMAVRNILYEMKCKYPLAMLNDECKYNPADQVYYCGGARKLKGTERKVTIVIGSEIDYTQFGIPVADYYKSLFVSLSRAIDQLIIIVPKSHGIKEDSPMGQVIHHSAVTTWEPIRHADGDDGDTHPGDAQGVSREAHFKFGHATQAVKKRLLTTVRVKDDVAEKARWIPETIGPETSLDLDLSILSPLRIRGNEDFAGCYIEAMIAVKLGADVTAWTDILTDPLHHVKILNRPETILQETHGLWVRGASPPFDPPIGGGSSHSDPPPGGSSNESTGSGVKGAARPCGGERGRNSPLCLLLRWGETREGVARQIDELRELAAIDLAYVLCVLSYTARVGKWWIASKEIYSAAQGIRAQLNEVVDKLCVKLIADPTIPSVSIVSTSSVAPPIKSGFITKKTTTGSIAADASSASGQSVVDEVIWGKTLNSSFLCHRSNKISCSITGIADLIIKWKPTVAIATTQSVTTTKAGDSGATTEMGGTEVGDSGGDRKVTSTSRCRPPLLLEIKFGVHKDAHLRQTAIYANLLDYKSGMLINLAENRIFEVSKTDTPKLELYCRAHLMLRNGRTHGLGKRIKVPDIAGAVMIALDVESDGFPPNAPLTETGAMAWYWGTEEVEDTFHRTVKGVLPLESPTRGIIPLQPPSLIDSQDRKDVAGGKGGGTPPSIPPSIAARITGLIATEESNSRDAQAEQKKLTKQWHNTIRGKKVHLVWGGCDDVTASGLGGSAPPMPPASKGDNSSPSSGGVPKVGGAHCKVPVIDLHRVYLKYLELNNCVRKGRAKLKDAVEHLCPDLPVRYHAAFDDVLATVFVANAIIEFGGTL